MDVNAGGSCENDIATSSHASKASQRHTTHYIRDDTDRNCSGEDVSDPVSGNLDERNLREFDAQESSSHRERSGSNAESSYLHSSFEISESSLDSRIRALSIHSGSHTEGSRRRARPEQFLSDERDDTTYEHHSDDEDIGAPEAIAKFMPRDAEHDGIASEAHAHHSDRVPPVNSRHDGFGDFSPRSNDVFVDDNDDDYRRHHRRRSSVGSGTRRHPRASDDAHTSIFDESSFFAGGEDEDGRDRNGDCDRDGDGGEDGGGDGEDRNGGGGGDHEAASSDAGGEGEETDDDDGSGDHRVFGGALSWRAFLFIFFSSRTEEVLPIKLTPPAPPEEKQQCSLFACA